VVVFLFTFNLFDKGNVSDSARAVLPHRLSVDERKRSRQYAEELQQRLTEMHTAEKHYESHCELNDLDPKSIEAFATFAVAMETGAGGRDPIQHSTRHGYLKCVLNSLRSNTDPIVAMRQYVVEDANRCFEHPAAREVRRGQQGERAMGRPKNLPKACPGQY